MTKRWGGAVARRRGAVVRRLHRHIHTHLHPLTTTTPHTQTYMSREKIRTRRPGNVARREANAELTLTPRRVLVRECVHVRVSVSLTCTNHPHSLLSLLSKHQSSGVLPPLHPSPSPDVPLTTSFVSPRPQKSAAVAVPLKRSVVPTPRQPTTPVPAIRPPAPMVPYPCVGGTR